MKLTNSNIKVRLDTSPLQSGHELRGIGVYTRLLAEFLSAEPTITLTTNNTNNSQVDLVHYPFFDFYFPTLPIKPWQKTVVTIHDVIPLIYPNQYPAGKKGTIYFKKQLLALKFVSAVITDSEVSKQDIHQYLKTPLARIFVVHLAGQPELSPAKEEAINHVKKKFGLKKPYVLYVGDINFNKNLPQLIKMLKYLPDEIQLVCFGKAMRESDIPEWKAIITQAALSNVESRICFISDVPHDDFSTLAALYSGALCYVQPSIYEGFGLPVLEAMQCATPVVVSNSASLPEITGEAGLLVDPEAEALAEGVLKVYNYSNSTRQKIISLGLAHANTFSWKKTAQQTIEVYRKVLAK